MITNRWLNWITAILMAIAVVGMGLVLFFTHTKGFSASATHFDYESTLFGGQVAQINLEVDQTEWENLLQNAIEKEYIPAQVTINGKTISQVGLRAKGNTSLTQVASDDTTDRYSFKLEFDHYISGQTFDGLDKLALNNVISDTTYMKEYLSYQMLESIGVRVPKYGFANITVNGQAWGFYFSVEVLEESFLQRNYGSNYGKLYKPESDEMGGGQRGEMPQGMRMPRQDATGELPPQTTESDSTGQQEPFVPKDGEEFRPGGFLGSTSGGSSLVYTDSSVDSYADIFDNAVTKTSAADQQRVITALEHLQNGEDLERYFDVDEILRYFAANTAMVNLDSYVGMFTHNYYLYEKDGQLSILPWDYNLSFGGFQLGSASDAVNFPIDTPTASGISLEDRPLIGKLLENEEYLERYHKYLDEIVKNYFESGLFELTVSKLDGMIASYVKNDASAFYTYEEYQAAVNELKTFGRLRAQSIRGQLDGTIPSTREGQQENPAALLDASGLDWSKLGSMGGGPMGKTENGASAFGQMGQEQQGAPGTPESPSDTQPPEQAVSFGRPVQEDPASDSQAPASQQAGKFGEGRRPAEGFLQNGSSPNTVSPYTWWTLGISTAAMLLGLGFVIVYRRRRFS